MKNPFLLTIITFASSLCLQAPADNSHQTPPSRVARLGKWTKSWFVHHYNQEINQTIDMVLEKVREIYNKAFLGDANRKDFVIYSLDLATPTGCTLRKSYKKQLAKITQTNNNQEIDKDILIIQKHYQLLETAKHSPTFHKSETANFFLQNLLETLSENTNMNHQDLAEELEKAVKSILDELKDQLKYKAASLRLDDKTLTANLISLIAKEAAEETSSPFSSNHHRMRFAQECNEDFEETFREQKKASDAKEGRRKADISWKRWLRSGSKPKSNEEVATHNEYNKNCELEAHKEALTDIQTWPKQKRGMAMIAAVLIPASCLIAYLTDEDEIPRKKKRSGSRRSS